MTPQDLAEYGRKARALVTLVLVPHDEWYDDVYLLHQKICIAYISLHPFLKLHLPTGGMAKVQKVGREAPTLEDCFSKGTRPGHVDCTVVRCPSKQLWNVWSFGCA